MTDQNWIAKSIVPKSDQLNAEDLLSGAITVTVQDVKQGTADQPIAIIIDGNRQPYKPCKTMRKVLVYCWTDQAANWIGKRITLYADPDVMWAKVKVGGIRISHLSGIEKEITLMLSETRGKRKAYSVKPLPDTEDEPPLQDGILGFIEYKRISNEPIDAAQFAELIEKASSVVELDGIAKAAVKAKLKPDELEFIKTMVTDARKLLSDVPM